MLILPLLVFSALTDWYICNDVWHRCHRRARMWRGVALWSSVAFALYLIAIILLPKKSAADGELSGIMWALYAYFTIYVPKYIFVLFDLLGKLPELFGKKYIKGLSYIGFGAAIVTFVAMWWGALVTRNNIDVRRVDYVDAAVPEAYDGFTIAQISDLHTGSFGTDTAFVSKLVDSVNALQPDVVIFSGDIVNRRSDELQPFIGPLSRLHARYGVYSVLGNHDYGDYYSWPSSEAKQANMQLLYDLQRQMGWQLLNNEHRVLRAAGDSLVIIGVENIGDPPFPVYGDLDKAYPRGLDDDAFKILISHNPAHWTDDIADSPDKRIALTLAGHTHAMQIELAGFSPAVFRYPKWGGMYADTDSVHHLYVNIGAGEVGIPARIGATPEVTLIILRRK